MKLCQKQCICQSEKEEEETTTGRWRTQEINRRQHDSVRENTSERNRDKQTGKYVHKAWRWNIETDWRDDGVWVQKETHDQHHASEMGKRQTWKRFSPNLLREVVELCVLKFTIKKAQASNHVTNHCGKKGKELQMGSLMNENTWENVLEKHTQTTSVIMNYTRPHSKRPHEQDRSHSKINFLKERYFRTGLLVQWSGVI